MGVSPALSRLLRIRDLVEEQGRIALESAMGDLNRLRHAQAATLGQDRRGRWLVGDSARSGELLDRLAGLEETRASDRATAALAPRIAAAEVDVASLRENYLAMRVERRQAEILIKEAEARSALEHDRRSQQALDDWFRNRLHREAPSAKLAHAARPMVGSGGSGDEDERDLGGGGGEA